MQLDRTNPFHRGIVWGYVSKAGGGFHSGCNRLKFQLEGGRADRPLLEGIRDFFGHGHVHDRQDRSVSTGGSYFIITNKAGFQQLIAFFGKYPLQGLAAEKFSDWLTAYLQLSGAPDKQQQEKNERAYV